MENYRNQSLFPTPWGCNCHIPRGEWDHRCANRPPTPPPRVAAVDDLIDLTEDLAGLGLTVRPPRRPRGVRFAAAAPAWPKEVTLITRGTQTSPPMTRNAACTATQADITEARAIRTRWVFPPPQRNPLRKPGIMRGRGKPKIPEQPSLIPRRPRSRARSRERPGSRPRSRSWHREGSPHPWRVPTPPAYYPESDGEISPPSPPAKPTRSMKRRWKRERRAREKAAQEVEKVLVAARDFLESQGQG